MPKIDLEIVIPTYNRAKYLEETLEYIVNGPEGVRDIYVTILDNASKDSTPEVCKKYADKYPNIKYIRNTRNIGGNGNIARSFEVGTHEYLWVLADDDKYDWTSWPQLEEACADGADLIVAGDDFKFADDLPNLMHNTVFLPVNIYKRSHINEEVLCNILAHIGSIFPHMGAFAAVINHKGKIVVLDKPLIKRGDDNLISDVCRRSSDVSIPRCSTHWLGGYMQSIMLINDKKLRREFIDKLSYTGGSFYHQISGELKKSRFGLGFYPPTIGSMFLMFNWRQKIVMLTALIRIEIARLFRRKHYEKKYNCYKEN
ncbi:glycosyltransferase involved in cell wall biosynthesis [Elusimicrobium simillimum]|uniref:glycosyltransferase family 2 protein n=1 Tax=Elusimicrobium simillimum TaxID=3143438 RepID=UPI003C701140